MLLAFISVIASRIERVSVSERFTDCMSILLPLHVSLGIWTNDHTSCPRRVWAETNAIAVCRIISTFRPLAAGLASVMLPGLSITILPVPSTAESAGNMT